MEFQVGVFARIEERYDFKSSKIIEHVVFKCHDWCDKDGVDYYKKEGKVLVKVFKFEFDETTAITRDQIVAGMVEGLKEKKKQMQAETQKAVTEIDARINKLLAIEYTPNETVKAKEAPFWTDQGGIDDIPF